jgi:hypothetical protein
LYFNADKQGQRVLRHWADDVADGEYGIDEVPPIVWHQLRRMVARLEPHEPTTESGVPLAGKEHPPSRPAAASGAVGQEGAVDNEQQPGTAPEPAGAPEKAKVERAPTSKPRPRKRRRHAT